MDLCSKTPRAAIIIVCPGAAVVVARGIPFALRIALHRDPAYAPFPVVPLSAVLIGVTRPVRGDSE